MHIEDSPERSARGIAVGLFVAFMPLAGLQMFLAYAIAWMCRANRVLSVLCSWISNPMTAVFIYYPCYRLGSFLLSSTGKPQYGSEQMHSLLHNTFSAHNIFNNLFTQDFWRQVFDVSKAIGLEIFIGGLILGAVFAKLGYWLSLVVIKRYRKRRHHFLKKLALRRASKLHRRTVA